jgi:hypothetical protein
MPCLPDRPVAASATRSLADRDAPVGGFMFAVGHRGARQVVAGITEPSMSIMNAAGVAVADLG